MTPDAHFSDPRLAVLYDPLDPDRWDLETYAALVAELGGRSVLDVARSRPGADAVTWWHGDATTLPSLAVDVATMTGSAGRPRWPASTLPCGLAAGSSSSRAIPTLRRGVTGRRSVRRPRRTSPVWGTSAPGSRSPRSTCRA